MANIFNLDNPEHLMLQDVKYYRNINENRDDILIIIYVDLLEKKVKKKEILNPTMKVWFTNPEYRNHNYIKSSEDINKVYEKELPYKNIIFEIPKELNDKSLMNRLKECISNRNFKGLQEAHLTGYTYGTDIDIISYVYIQWHLNYDNKYEKKPTSMFLDIEVDVYHNVGAISPEKNCPIDVITVIDKESMTSFTFILKVKDNMENINSFIDNLDNFKDSLHEKFDELYGYIDYKFKFYDDELNLLKDLFKLIHSLKRTFLFVWNMNFDIPFILGRIKKLGGDLQDIVCHSDFDFKYLKYYVDNIHFSRAKKVDKFEYSGYTKFLCQLNNYAGIRNNQGITSYKLTNVAEKEIGDKKYDFSEEGDLKSLSRRNFKKFILYNIKDVLLQLGIANRTKDPEFIYQAAMSTFTQYDNIMKPIIFLRNVAYVDYLKQGLVLGCNKNVFNEKGNKAVDEFGMLKNDEEDNMEETDEEVKSKKKDDGKADGALVSSPTKMKRSGLLLYGIRSNRIFNHCIDMDFSSLYPSIIIAFNISDVTLIGRLLIRNTPDSVLNPYKHEDGYSAGKDFIENLISDNTIMTGSKWFGLPTVTDLNDKLRRGMI